MNRYQIDVRQEKEDLNSSTKVRVRKGRWIVKGTNYSRGYAKLVHIVTGEKRYVAILNHPSYRSRYSWGLFETAESAVERRKKVFERLERMKAAG